MSADPEIDYCAFCGKAHHEVRLLIAGPMPGLFICDECIARMMNIVHDATFTVVPAEPTDAMIDAGLQATNAYLTLPGSQMTQNREKMRLRYKAMLAAYTG